MHSSFTEAVVVVHGLWMNTLTLSFIGHRLQHCGFEVSYFSYASVGANVPDNAEKLHQLIQTLSTDHVHLVGHSLGGLVIRQLFEHYPEQKWGRIVTLGTPHQGSQAAQDLAKHSWGQAILGKSTHKGGLLGDMNTWHGQRELGNLVGTWDVGFGKLFTNLPEPNDGTVSVQDCQLDHATDYIELPVSHLSMLLSPDVTDQTCFFLKNGRFKFD